MNGIIIDGKVYEAVPTVGYSDCDGCDLTEVCDAHAHDICNDCSKIFDTYIDDPCWHFRFSQSFTDKIKYRQNKKVMRQIKFRGKHKTTEEWIYGDLEHLPNNNIHIFSNHASQPVIAESVGQYTGLRDRNGKEIYEGDIITVKGNYPRVVLWDVVSWALMPCEHYHDKLFWVMNLQHPGNDWWEEFADEMEVVGNMYDNPELLKKLEL